MTKTMIEWTDEVWNPQTGCHYNCNYSATGCYAKTMARYRPTDAAKQFLPEFHEDRMDDLNNMLKGVVFAGSNGDMFGPWVSKEIMARIVGRARSYWSVNGHAAAIMFLTKNPARYVDAIPILEPRDRVQIWLGATLDPGYVSGAPKVEARIEAMVTLDYPKKWVSIEPLNFDYSHWCYDEILDMLSGSIGWVVIGTETHSGKPRPKGTSPDPTDIWEIIEACRDPVRIPVFVKDSIHQLWPEEKWPRQFPAGMVLATKAAAWHPKGTKARKPAIKANPLW